MDLRYKHVEAALARAYNVGESQLKAFRARLRHLRNLGIPRLPRVGTGTQLTYTQAHLLVFVAALELETIGLSPKDAAGVVDGLRDKLAASYARWAARGKSTYIVHMPGSRHLVESSTDDALSWTYLTDETPLLQEIEKMVRSERRFAVVNLSAAMKAADNAVALVANES